MRDGEAGDEPEFLADHREDIVGVRLGQREFADAGARPGAEQAAGGERAQRRFDLIGVALREQEAVDPLRATCRRDRPATTAAARPAAEHVEDAHRARPTASAASPRPTTKMIVSPKSGWRISSSAIDAGQHRRAAAPPAAAVLLLQRQQPGDGDDEQRLQEFGRLELGEADAEPAPRAVHLVPTSGTRNSRPMNSAAPSDATAAARVALGSIETPIITGIAEHDPDQLAVEIIERRRRGRRRPNSAAPPPARRRRPRSARSRSAPRRGSAAPGRSPRTSVRPRSGPSGRSAALSGCAAASCRRLPSRSCQRLHRSAERVAARLIIPELVERRAGRRQQHHLARRAPPAPLR